MLDFWISYFSVFFEDLTEAPTVQEIVYKLKESPYFKVVDVNYAEKDFKVWENWSFSAELKFPDWSFKKFDFLLKKVERGFEFYERENDLFNAYIMSPKKTQFDKESFWDLGILTDIREDEMEGLHKQFKVVASFPESKKYRDNSCYKIWNMEKAIHFANRSVLPDHKEWYMVHFVYKEILWWNKNWLHTHGLERFWFSEIEILDVPDEFTESSVSLLNHVAQMIIEEWEPDEIDVLDIWNWVMAHFMPYQMAIEYMWKNFFWKYEDRASHWDILSNVLMVKKKRFLGMGHKYESVAKYASVYSDAPYSYIPEDEAKRIKESSDEFIGKFWEVFDKHSSDENYKFSLRFGHLVPQSLRKEAWVDRVYLSYELVEKKWNKVICRELEKSPYTESKWWDLLHTKNIKDIIEWAIVKDWEIIVSDNLYKLKD